MSIVNGSLQNARATTAAIAASSAVPLDGQIVYNSQTGQYKIGDGVTTLSALSYYGGSGALTIGTTTITSGTDDGILYNNNGVVGEVTGLLAGQSIRKNSANTGFEAYYPLDIDAVNFIQAAAITNQTQRNAINALVVKLKNASLWDGAKAIYPYVGGTEAQHKFNLKDPRDLDAAYRITWTGTLAHSSNGVTYTNGIGETYLNALSVFGTNYPYVANYCRVWSTGIVIGANTGIYDWSSNGTLVTHSGGAGVSLSDKGNSSSLGRTGWRSLFRKDASNLYYKGAEIAQNFSANPNNTFTLGKISAGFQSNANVGFTIISDNLTKAQDYTLSVIVYEFQQDLSRALNEKAFFYGDSITVGVGASPSTNRWSTLLSVSKNWEEFNLGQSGTPLENQSPIVANNLIAIYLDRMPFKSGGDKYIFISHGVNDCGFNTTNYNTTNFSTELQTIITELLNRNWSASDIVINLGTYVNTAGWATYVPTYTPTPADNARYQSFITAAQTVANTNGCTYINNFVNMQNNGGDSLVGDGLHPNNAGYLVIKNYIDTII